MAFKIRYFFIFTFTLLLCFIWVRCANDDSSSPLPSINSVDDIGMSLLPSNSSVVSVEYTGSTLSKCKYLKNEVYIAVEDIYNTDMRASCKSSGERCTESQLKNINIYFPLKNPKIEGSKIKAKIQLAYSNYATPKGTTPTTCKNYIAAGRLINADSNKNWIHFLDLPSVDCFSPLEDSKNIVITISNYKKSSCSLSFEYTES